MDSHLETMDEIHRHLTVDLDYEMTNNLAVQGVLRSLPPSYKDVVIGYIMQGDAITFRELLAELRTQKVEPIAGEIIDGAGIFDIHVINVS